MPKHKAASVQCWWNSALEGLLSQEANRLQAGNAELHINDLNNLPPTNVSLYYSAPTFIICSLWELLALFFKLFSPNFYKFKYLEYLHFHIYTDEDK